MLLLQILTWEWQEGEQLNKLKEKKSMQELFFVYVVYLVPLIK